jgi:ribosomal protein L13E
MVKTWFKFEILYFVYRQSRISLAEKSASDPSSMLKPTKKKMKIKRGSNEMGRLVDIFPCTN